MKIYEDIESERDRIQNCIKKYGWTSDHNLDWFLDGAIKEGAHPLFVEFDDGTGILAHRYPDSARIWSDPLCNKADAAQRIREFSDYIFSLRIKEVWCDDVLDTIYPELVKSKDLKVGDIYYSLFWPVLDIAKYDAMLPGGDFKEMRNAKSKFYREHKLESIDASHFKKEDLFAIVENWKKAIEGREDIYDLKYHRAIENNFQGFSTSRVLVVDGIPVGFNAGYLVPNNPGRFAGVVGLHDYSIKDLGIILWLEDLEWVKNAGYKEMDLQGTEDNQELKFKMQFNPTIERKTDCFSIFPK
jgi:hypothetical protein